MRNPLHDRLLHAHLRTSAVDWRASPLMRSIIRDAPMGCPDPNQLQGFFDQVTSPDETVRLREHFAECHDCRTLVLALAPEPALSPDAPTLQAVAMPRKANVETGARVGRYVILGRIGEGGMGVVYTAHDPELDRKVAVKVLRVDTRPDEAELHRRLQREAQALARLSHPSVTAVYDVGTCAQGVFIAMELVDGETLGRWLEREQPWRAVVDVFVRAGRGLEAAHLAGLVHRDFKPDNVLVGKDGRVRVTDFGLARIDSAAQSYHGDGDSPLHFSLTRSGMLVGTPAYMAPEQMSGDAVDARCDIFSFCVALYEGLYRRRPFDGETLQALRAAIALDRVREPPRSDVPERVRRAILRGLRAAPDDRQPTIGELLTLLEREALAPRRSRMLTIGLPLSILLAAIVAMPLSRSLRTPARSIALATPPPPRPMLPPALAPITLRITSQPAGAAVYRVSDGVQLGTTPFSQTLQPVSGIMRFVLKLSAYADEQVVVPADADGERAIVLRKQPRRETHAGKTAPAKVKLDDPFGD